MSHHHSDTYTRGGQIFAHQVCMMTQVGKISCVTALSATSLWIVWSFVMQIRLFDAYIWLEYHWVAYKIKMAVSLKGVTAASHVMTSIYHGGSWQKWHATQFLHHPTVCAIKKVMDIQLSHWFFNNVCLYGSLFFVLTFLGTIVFFKQKGRSKQKKHLERGVRFLKGAALQKLLKKKNLASDLKLDALSLVKNKETSHILHVGTTGSGKTNAFHTLIPQIRKRGDRAVVVDLSGDFVAKYYRPGQDIIINPFDERSHDWNPWDECLSETHYDALAAAIVPKDNRLDSFWCEAGKIVLSSAMIKLKESHQDHIEDLYHLLVLEDFTKFSTFFAGTEAASHTHKDGERMALSIRATLNNHIRFLKHLGKSQKSFSMRRWIEDDTNISWVFLTARADQRDTLRPLISGILDTGINALMSQKPDSNRRVWFFGDELPALHKLPSLEPGLAELRKYGGCIMAGVQGLSQLETIYGQQQSRTILGLFNTKIFFRSIDPQTTQWISQVLGESEQTEFIENTSYGANTIRDGVSLNQSTQKKPLILPSEIANLSDLECYVSYPQDLPVTKLKMSYKDYPLQQEAFCEVKERRKSEKVILFKGMSLQNNIIMKEGESA